MVAVLGPILAVAGTASAAQAAERGCFGEDVLAAARAFAPFGANVVASGARQGLLSGHVRAMRAGDIPDEAFPNTCNSLRCCSIELILVIRHGP